MAFQGVSWKEFVFLRDTSSYTNYYHILRLKACNVVFRRFVHGPTYGYVIGAVIGPNSPVQIIILASA